MSQRNRLFAAILIGALVFPAGSTELDLATSPLFLSNQVQPSIILMLDNSGSMKEPMYQNGGDLENFDPAKNYHGLFEASKNYRYDSAIPVDISVYPVPLDSRAAGAFVESNCTPASGDSICWSGNFLNWLTTRRIDAARKILIGGKVENRAGYDYLGNDSPQYKIIGNNEPSDPFFRGSTPVSSQYSPIPDDRFISVISTASGGMILPTYQPYAQIVIGSSDTGFVYNDTRTKIGEFGTVRVTTTVNGSKALDPSSWTHVTFQKNYPVSPIVVARTLSYNEMEGGVVRIRNLTTAGFDITFQEWPNEDGNHASEQIQYLALESGSHTLLGGLKLEAGTISSNQRSQSLCPGVVAEATNVTFSQTFAASPVVLTSVVSFNESDAVNSRAWNITPTGFSLALQEAQNGDSHFAEEVAYVAVAKGVVMDITQPFYLEAGTIANLSGSQNFTFNNSFPASPGFLAAMQTINENDPAVLRPDGIAIDRVQVRVEEEKSCDAETTHLAEDVGYLALSNAGELFNIAVVSPGLPQGVVQQVKDSVRVGVSFYRFNQNANDIYRNNLTDGGTLDFQIPKNPFVRKPSDATLPDSQKGYRTLSGYVGTPVAELIDAIEHYPLISGTSPLAENLWEVIQYFSQNSPFYDNGDFLLADGGNPQRDPYYQSDFGQKMACTRSQVLVLSDGQPYKDANIPLSLLDYDGDGNVATNCIDPLTQAKDCVSTDPNAFGHDNLDDVAYWAFCDASKGSCLNSVTGIADTPSRDLRTDLVDDQFLRIDTVAFAGATILPVLQHAADNGGGIAQTASDGLALGNALNQVFTKIAGSTSASVAIDTGNIQNNSRLFLARFDNVDWSGNLLAFQINPDGSLAHHLDANGLIVPDIPPGWEAASQIPQPNARIIVTYDGSTGIPFRWNQLSGIQKLLLDPVNAIKPASPVLDWLRGDHSQESKNGGNLRDRNTTVLGDIVHSAPAFVGAPDFHYPDDLEGGSHLYSAFKVAKENRSPMVYVGANDGMLHGFDAATGAEKLAYVPNEVFERLAALTQPNYVHQYTVDGAPTVVDAFFGNAWHTVLVAGLRGGGQGVYALDVTDPAVDFANESGAAAKVLWEYSDKNGAPDLGFTFSVPNIVRLHNGEWAAVFGNGYNNTLGDGQASLTGNAVLFIVRLSDGTLIRKIDTGAGISDPASGGKPNGLATVAPVDVDGDAIADYVYGGDLYGHLWKFDLTDTTSNQWKVAFSPLDCASSSSCTPLFTACSGVPCTSSSRQPITVRPQVSKHPTGTGYLVFFGTGKYLENNDNSALGQLTQSFYAIWDKNAGVLSAFDRSNLKQRKILAETSAFGFNVRVTSGVADDLAKGGGAIDWTNDMGWFLDLINTAGGNTDNQGERIVNAPIFRSGKIIFTTLIPSNDPCLAGGNGWLMELDANQGTRLTDSPFDLNLDGTFNRKDEAGVNWDVNANGQLDAEDTVAVSGVKSTVGIISSPSIASDQQGLKEYNYNSGSTGNVQITPGNPGLGKTGRLSWRQIR